MTTAILAPGAWQGGEMELPQGTHGSKRLEKNGSRSQFAAIASRENGKNAKALRILGTFDFKRNSIRFLIVFVRDSPLEF